MTLLLVGPIAVAMLALLPTGLERLSRRINAPQAMATGFGLSLLGWAIVPPAWILCSIGSVVDLTAHRELTDFGCALGLGTAPWDLSGYLLTAAVIIPVSLSLFLHIHRMTTGVRPFDTNLFSESQLRAFTTAPGRQWARKTGRVLEFAVKSVRSPGFL
ncbi:hypothetical protein [Ferrimicrobium acidiphilum]|uniref:hypothetical protein n=1 Tax=Ferrimicrobium acidiphilum TaxID=121039 RepID=UPI0023F3183B|nr:hypothetical protein [Ferrimicrobium acidiphilum]